METSGQGQRELLAQVINRDLCTACGACASYCPYLVSYRDRTALFHHCDLTEGKCYSSCPRTGLDISALQKFCFPGSPLTAELGPFKGYHQARARQATDRMKAQHGGVVTTLLTLALTEGIIDAAILSEKREKFLPQAIVATTVEHIRACGGSRFVVAPLLAQFIRSAREGTGRIGMVLLPCQLQALAKIRLVTTDTDEPIGSPALSIGLFCGWSLVWRDFVKLLQTMTAIDAVTGMDIPSRQDLLEIKAGPHSCKVPLASIQSLIRPACRFCVDTTSEFSDISVGSAGDTGAGADPGGWNQVIIRSDRGQDLFNLALERGLIETRPTSDGSLRELKHAARAKKRQALDNLIVKSGSPDDLIYLNPKDPLLADILSHFQ